MLAEAEAATPPGSPGFVSVQNQYNILYREPEDGVLAALRTHGDGLPALLPSGQRAPERQVPGGRAAARGHPARRDGRQGGRSAAPTTGSPPWPPSESWRGRHGHTVLDLAFGWLLSRPAVASVIAGATRPEQIAANVAAGEWRPGEDVLAEVDALAPR